MENQMETGSDIVAHDGIVAACYTMAAQVNIQTQNLTVNYKGTISLSIRASPLSNGPCKYILEDCVLRV